MWLVTRAWAARRRRRQQLLPEAGCGGPGSHTPPRDRKSGRGAGERAEFLNHDQVETPSSCRQEGQRRGGLLSAGALKSSGPWECRGYLDLSKAFAKVSNEILVNKMVPCGLEDATVSLANIPLTPETQRDQERRIRREIANSNERRRMQSINAGFQSLKTLIPHTDGEKLSKAAILQQTAEYIFSLEQEKTRLLQQNAQLKRFIQELSGSSPKRRRAEDKDEGIGSPDIWEDEKAEDLRREMIELRQQLDKERSVRMMLEEQVRSLEAHMYPEKLKVIAQQVQLQQQQEQLLPVHGPPAPTHHPTVIVPAPPPPHHVTVVTMGPSSVINTISTSRQNLDTIVQAIQHIEGTQEKQLLEEEERQRRAVIVTPARASLDPSNSDTASDSEAEDSDSMGHSKAEMP